MPAAVATPSTERFLGRPLKHAHSRVLFRVFHCLFARWASRHQHGQLQCTTLSVLYYSITLLNIYTISINTRARGVEAPLTTRPRPSRPSCQPSCPSCHPSPRHAVSQTAASRHAPDVCTPLRADGGQILQLLRANCRRRRLQPLRAVLDLAHGLFASAAAAAVASAFVVSQQLAALEPATRADSPAQLWARARPLRARHRLQEHGRCASRASLRHFPYNALDGLLAACGI